MQGTVKKVTLELIYDVVDGRTKELKDEVRSISGRIDQLRQETKDNFRDVQKEFQTINGRIDQIHVRIDKIMQMLVTISRK